MKTNFQFHITVVLQCLQGVQEVEQYRLDILASPSHSIDSGTKLLESDPVCDLYGQDFNESRREKQSILGASKLHLCYSQMMWLCRLHQTVTFSMH